MEINVGEYVRYGQKGILYFKDYIKDNYGKRAYLSSVCEREILINKKYIDNFSKYKHSKDIINLIEVGDYVNGYRVVETYNATGEQMIFITILTDKGYKTILNNKFETKYIKSVLTKEQFEANAYTIEKER